MPANVVAPETEANVGRGISKLGLVGQRFPVNDTIALETDLVTLVAQPAIAVKYQRPFALVLHIAVVHVV